MTNFKMPDLTALSNPMQKLIDLNVAKIESAVEAQQAAAKNLVELTEARAKAASEIKDYDGFVSFMKDQAELAQSNVEKLSADSQAAVEEARAYGEEVQKIMQESVETVKSAVTP